MCVLLRSLELPVVAKVVSLLRDPPATGTGSNTDLIYRQWFIHVTEQPQSCRVRQASDLHFARQVHVRKITAQVDVGPPKMLVLAVPRVCFQLIHDPRQRLQVRVMLAHVHVVNVFEFTAWLDVIQAYIVCRDDHFRMHCVPALYFLHHQGAKLLP